MFQLNLKLAVRNLFKNKVYSFINIGGLAIGLTAFVLLLLFINHETNYDKWSPELKNVYQIREHHDFFTPDNKQYWQEMNETRTANLVRNNIPQFNAVTKVDWSWGEGFSVKTENSDAVIVKNIKNADSLFFKVFPYEFIQGDRLSSLNTPSSIVLKHSLAIKLFGTDKVLGKQVKLLMWRSDKGTSFTITGVVKDPESPESVEFNAIMRNGELDKDPEDINNSHFSHVYALANVPVDTLATNKLLQKVYVNFKKTSFKARKISYAEYYKNGKTPGLKAIPMYDVHSNPPYTTGWFDKIKPLVAISIFLLVISIINFVNLATAQSVQRAKEVGVKKVLGVYKRELISQFLFESTIQSLTALFISIVLVEVLLPSFSNHFDVQLSFWHSAQLGSIALQLFGLFIVITLLAGFYPALVLSSYNPVKVLKGNYENGFKGIALRNALVIVQFIIAVTFIIGIGVMHLQTSYVANKDLGFRRDKLINISTNYNQNDPFAEGIKRIPGVKYVATTTQVIGNTFNVPEQIVYNNQDFEVNTVTVSMDALLALGVQVVKGRIFSREYKQDTINTVVLNQSAANLLGGNLIGKQYAIKVNKEKYVFQIIGVIKDYHNEGFDKAVLPTIYKVADLGGTSSTNNMLVRFDSDNYKNFVKSIEAEWKKLYPDFPMKYVTVEDAFQESLKSTKRLMQIVILFSTLSVILSLLGLFALSTFVAKRRTKEIAIRKILGASNIQIVNMLNRSFLFLVMAANLISWPIAFILTKKWLDGFAYRIDLPFAPFLTATVISLIIAIFTVTIQARKAAVSNPVAALKYE
ncbi:MAG: ABC transporter permease [Bacteroidota bacterium]